MYTSSNITLTGQEEARRSDFCITISQPDQTGHHASVNVLNTDVIQVVDLLLSQCTRSELVGIARQAVGRLEDIG
jgi:hypothetical protein